MSSECKYHLDPKLKAFKIFSTQALKSFMMREMFAIK